MDAENIVSELLDQLATAYVENALGVHGPSIQDGGAWGKGKKCAAGSVCRPGVEQRLPRWS
jgi:hypothetical protein